MNKVMNRHDSYWIFGGQTLIIQAISSSSFPFLFQQGVSLDCLVTCLSDEDIQKGGTTMRDDHATHHLTGEREREREGRIFNESYIRCEALRFLRVEKSSQSDASQARLM